MRCVSQLFQPIITIPKNAKIKNTEISCKSQKLLLECGFIRPTSSGFFSLLPLARRVIDKLETLVSKYIEAAGAQRISLPAVTAAHLWEKTGRLRGEELLTVEDRHEKKFVLSPTHEEAIADLLADVGPVSYKQLPLLLYQISNKYRDELRPKHGLLRAREFTMLDAYGAHSSQHCASQVYERVTEAYTRLFRALDLNVYRVEAPGGDMGGGVSHEWQLPAAAGEGGLRLCGGCALLVARGACARCGAEPRLAPSIEVGHTFLLGTQYSDPLGARFTPPSGPPQPLYMSCYGIGITRLLAASVEALSSDTELRWPLAIAPYSAIIIGPKEGSREWAALAEGGEGEVRAGGMLGRVCRAARAALRGDVLLDDEHGLTVGRRLLRASRMGYPTIIVCGRSALESPPRVEVHRCSGPGHSLQLMTLAEMEDMLASTHGHTEDNHQDIAPIRI